MNQNQKKSAIDLRSKETQIEMKDEKQYKETEIKSENKSQVEFDEYNFTQSQLSSQKKNQSN